jgi:hypothetical protein
MPSRANASVRAMITNSRRTRVDRRLEAVAHLAGETVALFGR